MMTLFFKYLQSIINQLNFNTMKKIYKIKKMPVMAGMQFGSNDYKIKKVATDYFKQEFILHPDGDLQFNNSIRIKRVFI